jgi:S-methylmethionine-dependent homocysteine/selenocysteine methylase
MPDTHTNWSRSGSYGADITPEKLKDFHRRRLQVLASAGPDLIAFEAIPNKMEAQVQYILNQSSM